MNQEDDEQYKQGFINSEQQKCRSGAAEGATEEKDEEGGMEDVEQKEIGRAHV